MQVLFFTHTNSPKDLLPEGYSARIEDRGRIETVSIVDTHDWRLWHTGNAALVYDDRIELRHLDTWLAETTQNDNFSVDGYLIEGDGPAVERVKKAVFPRALARRYKIKQQIDAWAVRNIDEKIVCRAEIIQLANEKSGRTKVTGVIFRPLRGYEEETCEIEKCARRISGTERAAPAGAADPVSLLLQKNKDSPTRFLSHKSLSLKEGLPLSGASRDLLLSLTDVMAASVPGILEDIDTEFLHDFRVCVRKSRAFLSLLKSSLNSGAVAPHQEFLRKCGSLTNEMRDLDVYLLEFSHFYALLPPSLIEYLKAFYDEIQTKRMTAKKTLKAGLSDMTYTAGYVSWRKFLKSENLLAKDAVSDSNLLGRRLILRRYKKVRKLASIITGQTPDADLHALRIECKKLRYCIEFFKAAVHEPIVDDVLSLLKTLQDVLGEFNDLSVQQRWLNDALHSQDVVRGSGMQAAIGGLMTSLYAKQQFTRQLIFEKFSRFVDKNVASRIAEIKPEEYK